MIARPKACDGCCLNPTSPNFNGNPGGFAHPTSSGLRLSAPGPVESDLVVVGYYPGAEEEAEGQCFVGPSGRRLNAGLAWSGIEAERDQVLKINIVNCRTVTEGRDGERINRNPTAAEIRDCTARWLWPALRSLQAEPNVLLLLGAEAYRTVCGSRWRYSHVRNNRLVVAEGIGGLAWKE